MILSTYYVYTFQEILCLAGTGTPVGDPVEANALGTFFSFNGRSKRRVYIGSVKSNIGHLESAAGVAGLIKVLLMIKYNTIVPSLMYSPENENPRVNFKNYGFVVPTKCIPWPQLTNRIRTACVNSFGFGGTNAHAIVQDFSISSIGTCCQMSPPYVIALSAPDHESLKQNVNCFLQDIKAHSNIDLATLSFTSTCRRTHLQERKAFLVETTAQLETACREFLNTQSPKRKGNTQARLVFVFCGVGTVWNGMCQKLLNMTAFANAIEAMDQILLPLAGWSMESKLSRKEDLLNDPIVTHISIFACQIGLAAMWQSFGINPDAVVGQSVGEVAAAYIAGKIDLASAVKIIFFRSKFLSEVTGGTMAIVNNIPLEQIEAYCSSKQDTLNIAVYNSPVSCTVAGDKDAIQSLKEYLKAASTKDGAFVDLSVKCAYHSRHVQPVVGKLMNRLTKLKGCQSETPIFSTVTGKREPDWCYSTGKYWGNNVRWPVLFSDAIKASASSSDTTIFLELGPGPVLRAHAHNLFDGDTVFEVLPSMTKGQSLQSIMQTMCKLCEYGYNLRWENIVPQTANTTEIPRYLFQKQSTLYKNPTVLLKNQGVDVEEKSHLYLERVADISQSPQFNAKINNVNTPFIYEHLVKGHILVPGAFHADIGFELAKAGLGFQLEEIAVSVEFLRPIRLEKYRQQILSVTSSKDEIGILFCVKQGQTTMCKGKAGKSHIQSQDNLIIHLNDLKQNFPKGVTHTQVDLYSKLKDFGFEYGTCFRVMKQAHANENSCLVEIEIPSEVLANVKRTTLHPCILDGLFQTTMAINDHPLAEVVEKEKLSFLPVAVEAIRIQRKPVRHMFIYTKRTNATILGTVFKLHYNSVMFDGQGNVIAHIINYTTYSKITTLNTPDELKYRLTWRPVSTMQNSESKRLLLVVNSPDKSFLETVCFENAAVCYPDSQDAHYEDVMKQITEQSLAKWHSKQGMDAIIVIFDKREVPNNLKATDADQIYDDTKSNCWLLVELIRYLVNEDIRKPLFIVTQNTQTSAVSLEENVCVDLNGSEIWGFIRSVQVEFVHNQMTLVDLQPSLKETEKTFINFINAAIENLDTSETEIKIYYDQIFSSSFSTNSVTESMPVFRQVQCRKMQEYSVRSKSATTVSDPYILHENGSGQSQDMTKKNVISLRVKHIYLHAPTIYPATSTSFREKENEWLDHQQEGHAVMGVEFTGYQIDRQSKLRFRCGTSRIEPEAEQYENEWESIAVFPTEMKSVVQVPRDCTISMKELPFYQDGLLFNSILSLVMSENVPLDSDVLVKFDNDNHILVSLLKKILVCRRRAKIIDMDSFENANVVLSTCSRELHYNILKHAKRVICFKYAIPADTHKRLTIKDGIEIIEIDVARTLSPDKVTKLLRKTVSWLKKNVHQFSLQNFFSATSRCEESSGTENHQGSYIDNLSRIETFCLPTLVSLSDVFDKASTYVITGGLTGLGWELLLLLAQMGAGTIASISRRAVSAEKAEQIEEIQNCYCCKIMCLQADVNDMKALTNAIETLQAIPNAGIIRGIFHGAGMLDSALLLYMKQEQLENVMKPKVLGTLNLHIVTRNHQLDFFFLQSSITSIIGAPGQSNYGAANSFLDAFAKWRRSNNLPAQAVNWGALEVGMAANKDFIDNFERRGYHLLSIPEMHSSFQQAVMQNSTEVVYASLDWQLVAKDYSSPQMSRIKMKMAITIDEKNASVQLSDNADIANGLDIELIRKSEPDVQQEALTAFVQAVAKGVLENDIDSYTVTSTFAELGLDSMSIVTFINIVADVTRCRIDHKFMLDPQRTLADVVTYLLDNLINKQEESDDQALAKVDI